MLSPALVPPPSQPALQMESHLGHVIPAVASFSVPPSQVPLRVATALLPYFPGVDAFQSCLKHASHQVQSKG